MLTIKKNQLRAYKDGQAIPLPYFTNAQTEQINENTLDIAEHSAQISNIVGTSDAWVSTRSYAIGDMVIYNNKLWKCILANSGQTPTEGTYWINVSLATLNNNLVVPIPYNEYFTNAPSVQTFNAMLIAGKIMVINMLTNTINAGWANNFGNINSKYRPSETVVFGGVDYSGGCKSEMSLEPNGSLSIYNGYGATSTVGATLVYNI